MNDLTERKEPSLYEKHRTCIYIYIYRHLDERVRIQFSIVHWESLCKDCDQMDQEAQSYVSEI